jgi:hypothetical protein
LSKYRPFALTVALLLSQPVLAHEPGAHVHGVASLEIALDGKLLTLEFSSPLDNLIGFEHLPQTDRQKALVRAMADKLNKADKLFVPTPAASCTLQNTELSSPVLPQALGSKPQPQEESGHADLDAEFVFSCQNPDKLHDIEARLFTPFPNLHQLNAAVVTAKGQSAARLTSDNRRVSW